MHLQAEQMVSPMSFHFVFVACSTTLPLPYVRPSNLPQVLQHLFPMAKPRKAESNRSQILGNVGELTTVGSRQKKCTEEGYKQG